MGKENWEVTIKWNTYCLVMSSSNYSLDDYGYCLNAVDTKELLKQGEEIGLF